LIVKRPSEGDIGQVGAKIELTPGRNRRALVLNKCIKNVKSDGKTKVWISGL
jgi:hypothetical protein